MSAIKNYIEVVRKGRGVVFVSSNEEQVAECIIEISDRLERLEAQAHSHAVSQSPAADLQNIPEGTLYVGDTERSCSNCRYEKYADEEEPCCSCKGLDKWQPRAERSCDNCFYQQDCLDEGNRCRSGDKVPSAWKPRAEQEEKILLTQSCGIGQAYRDSTGQIMVSMDGHKWQWIDSLFKERDDLRARLDEAERIARENGELALARRAEIKRLEKENKKLKKDYDEVLEDERLTRR